MVTKMKINRRQVHTQFIYCTAPFYITHLDPHTWGHSMLVIWLLDVQFKVRSTRRTYLVPSSTTYGTPGTVVIIDTCTCSGYDNVGTG